MGCIFYSMFYIEAPYIFNKDLLASKSLEFSGKEEIMEFIKHSIMYYFIAFGVLFGGTLFGGLAAFITKQPPIYTMFDYADRLKIWALVVALGGTFDSIKVFEAGIFDGNMTSLVKQIIYIFIAMAGAYTGQLTILWLFKGDIQP